ncbi:MAG TPA: flagellar hook-basal body complex protein FliE [Rhodospirillales bacterium]|jgi:flagellar hook-basal body complex protein FliE
MSTPSQSITNAINAYNQTARGGKPTETKPQAAGGDFADLVKGAIEEAKKIGQKSEKLSIAGVADRADINQVVTAVAEAEVALQTVVAIRDKVIDAYKEIIRMPM